LVASAASERENDLVDLSGLGRAATLLTGAVEAMKLKTTGHQHKNTYPKGQSMMEETENNLVRAATRSIGNYKYLGLDS
jgi:hypothetical protein